MGNAIPIYLMSEEDAVNHELKKRTLRKGEKFQLILEPNTDGHGVCHQLRDWLQFKYSDPSAVTLWLLDNNDKIVGELNYKNCPTKKYLSWLSIKS